MFAFKMITMNQDLYWNSKQNIPPTNEIVTLMCIGPCIILITEEQNPTRYHLLLYCAYVRLNMFQAPLCPSSGAHDDSVGYHIGRLVLELLLVGS